MKIFISHQKSDNQFIHRLTGLLRKYKIDYWVDTEQLYDKITYINREIKKGLDNSSHFLLIWSVNAKNSKWVKQEVTITSHKRKYKQFSFRLDDTQLRGFSQRFRNLPYSRVTFSDLEEKVRDFIFMKIISEGQFISQIRVLKDKIKHDFEHFGKYTKNDEELSIKSFKRYDIFNQFVSQKCVINRSKKAEDILNYLTHLLLHGKPKFIIVEGGYGSGKSLLSLFILYNLCKIVDNDGIIPFYIPLGRLENYDYELPETLVDSMFQFVKKEYKVADKDAFYQNMNDGKLTFILDALDELSPGFYPNIIDTNIRNVTKLVEKGNTVMLTSRSTYLSEDQEKNLTNEAELIEISDFDETLKNKFIDKKFSGHTLTFSKAAFIRTLQKVEIRQYTGKPLFLEIICNRYSDIVESPIVNPASILKILTDEWIKHDVYKRELDNQIINQQIQIRQRISESIALQVNKRGFSYPISIEDIRKGINEEFALEKDIQYTRSELLQIYEDAKNATFLRKEISQTGGDAFSFIYRSVAEYLVARRIITYINQNSDGSRTESILRYMDEISTLETFEFMKYIIDIEWAIKPHVLNELAANQSREYGSVISRRIDKTGEVLGLIEDAKNNSKYPDPQNNPPMGNLVTLLYLMGDFAKYNLSPARNIKEFEFSNCNLKGVRLSHADLTDIIFTNADLSNADLSNADLSRANLSSVTLYYTNFTGANLTDADLTTSKMIETKLVKADLTGANLTDADTTMGNDYAGYDGMYHVNLSNANLFGVNLSGADLTSSIIVNPISFQQLKGNSKTDLTRSITTSPFFIDHVSQFTNKGPELITSIDDLRNWIDSIDEVFDKNLMETLSKICNFGS